jgi:hypothetical protein
MVIAGELIADDAVEDMIDGDTVEGIRGGIDDAVEYVQESIEDAGEFVEDTIDDIGNFDF